MQNKILDMLLSTDSYVSGQDISEKLGVSRQAIWKAITSLKNDGWQIESSTRKGYRIAELPKFLNKPALRRELKTGIIGKNLYVLDSVGSTNDFLKIKALENVPSGTVATSREQTSGKGRLGRVWQTAKDDGLAFSILLRPSLAPSEVSAITPLAGLAVCKALREYTGLDCRIKWPNDIIIGNKKLVGILTEMSAEFDAVEYVITGIGINVGHTAFPQEIAHKATSLLLETGTLINPNRLLAKILQSIEQEFISSNLRFMPSTIEDYKSLCATIGRQVSFSRSGVKYTATAVDIAQGGELVVELEDKTQLFINSGEVTVQGIY